MELYDKTPETPFLRSDCDGQCMQMSGYTHLPGHQHHHHHHHKPSTSQVGLLEQISDTVSREEKENRLNQLQESSVHAKITFRRTPSRSSSRASHVSQEELDKKIKKTLDINDPRRTDYTYSHSGTYRQKQPTPEWWNPKMSRRGLHAQVKFEKTKTGITPLNWLSYTLMWLRKRREDSLEKEAEQHSFSDDENSQEFPNGFVTGMPIKSIRGSDSFSETSSKHQFRLVTSAISSFISIFHWVLFMISSIVIWPAQLFRHNRSKKNISECNEDRVVAESWERESFSEEFITNREKTEKNRSKLGCCGSPWLCCCVFPLLLLLLLAAGMKNEETKKIIQNYIFPFPVLCLNRTREFISRETSRYYSWYIGPSNRTETRNFRFNAEVSRADFMRLQNSVKQLETRLDAFFSSCCKEPDLTGFLKGSDVSALISENNDLQKLRSDVVFLEKQLAVVLNKLDSVSSTADSSFAQLQQQLTYLHGKLELLAEKNGSVSPEVLEKLKGLTALASRLNALETVVVEIKQKDWLSGSQFRNGLNENRKQLLAYTHEQKSYMEKTWLAELNALLETLKSQEARLADLKATQQSWVKELDKRSDTVSTTTEGGITVEQVKVLIAAAVERYDMDKTGLADHALEPAGGSVLSTRCSETYSPRTRKESIFGFPLWYSTYSPRVVIQPGVVPGECWAFKESSGFLVVQLSGWIEISGFAYEHIPKSMSPDGHIESAPREFEVWGLMHEKDTDGILLGKYIYDQNGKPLQQFDVQAKDVGAIPIVELKILSNHGNPVYTCLYRFRVHGRRVKPAYGTI